MFARIMEPMFIAVATFMMMIILLQEITLPGLYYDEVIHVAYGVWLLTGTPPFFPVWGGRYGIFGFQILYSVSPHVGPLQAYVALFSMYLLGISPLAVRLSPTLFMLLTTPFLYYFMKRRFGKVSAYVTTSLFAFSPSIILFTRVGFWVMITLVFFAVAALYFFSEWFSRRRMVALILGSFLMGLGVQTFITAVWIILSGVAITLLYLRVRLSVREVAVSLVSFLCGVGPYLLPWLSGHNILFFSKYSTVSYSGVSNLSYLGNLLERILEFGALLGSTPFRFYGGTHTTPLNVTFFVISLAGTVTFLALGLTENRTRKAQIVLTLLFGLILLQTPITISSLQPYHLIPLLPISFMIMGSFFESLWSGKWISLTQISRRNTRRVLTWSRVALLLILFSTVSYNLSTIHAYQIDLNRSGGVGHWSDATYAAANYLQTLRCSHVVAVDWGLTTHC